MNGDRPYLAHRRAYPPRLWPCALLAGVLAVALNLWLAPGAFAQVGLSVGIGAGVMTARWKVWRYRHPIITVDEHLDDLRRQARWN
jgi:hypothetical protein